MKCWSLAAATAALVAAAVPAEAQQRADVLSLRLGGREIRLEPAVRVRLASLARETLARCGPNTRQHPDNFGLAAFTVEKRWKELAEGSRLRIVFAEPFTTVSHLGGSLGVSEALIGLEHKDFFVGPDFTRYGSALAMLAAMDASPLSIVSRVTPRFDCRICTIDEIAASGLEISWQARASMKPSDARRCVCGLAAAAGGSSGRRPSGPVTGINPSSSDRTGAMKHTPLFDQHIRDASVVINLKGFARAMEYQGHLAEHEAVRSSAGLCDVSHMGEIEFKGPDALALVQKLITNDAGRLAVNQALYSVMCDEKGCVIDDLVCFRLATDHFLWVVNVTKTDEDFQWVLKHAAGMDVAVRNLSTDTALMALQGPESREVLQRITKADLSTLQYYWLTPTTIYTARSEVPCVVSRTGYTGELGYEIMTAKEHAPWVWDELLLVGRPLGVVAAGVAARESLRTEAGYLLNGNDMDGVTNPFEAGLGWTVKFSKDFVGKAALEEVRKKGVSRKLVGLEVQARLTIRNGYPLLKDGAQVGRVTSGPLWGSAADDRSLGLGYVSIEHSGAGTEMEVEIHGKRRKVRVVDLPLRERRVKSEPAMKTWSPYDLRFSESHVWLREESGSADTVSLGISDFGQRSLGRILCALLPQPGDKLKAGTALGWLDSYRRPFDIVSPVAGEVISVDAELMKNPARINAYPYLRSGIVRIRLAGPIESGGLMSFKDYAVLTARLSAYEAWSSDRRVL